MKYKQIIETLYKSYTAICEQVPHGEEFDTLKELRAEVERLHNETGEPNELGDSLILFVVREIEEVTRGETADTVAKVIARSMRYAESELGCIAQAFENIAYGE